VIIVPVGEQDSDDLAPGHCRQDRRSVVGRVDDDEPALFATHGPTSSPPQSWMFKRAPSAMEWQAQLAGQTLLTVSAAEALEAVRTAWAAAVGEG
jgi:hypothetical protein